MPSKPKRLVALGLVAISMVLLVPGLLAPVITIRGVLTRDGIAHVAPLMLQRGLDDETMEILKSMINPSILGFLQATGSDLRKMIVDKLTPQLTTALQKSAEDVEVYAQTRSILGAVRNLYEVGSPIPATLILLFSVVVPFAKAGLVAWALFMQDAWRRRTLTFVETIGKWSMADVFAVALFIVYLAAQATQTPPSSLASAPPLIAFTAQFGSGFYWFTAYCLFALATQQITTRLVASSDTTTSEVA
jgi:hypothetical protein